VKISRESAIWGLVPKLPGVSEAHVSQRAAAKPHCGAPCSSARSEVLQRTTAMDPQRQELGPFHVPIVPMSVKAPVAASMLYMETSFEPEFVT
jgi:hypothetical protein